MAFESHCFCGICAMSRPAPPSATVSPKKGRKKLDGAITVEDVGYGDRKVIRNLSDRQREAIAERVDQFGKIPLR
jgi:hypothetical protein